MGAEAMFFGALISALLVLRLGMAAWPPPLEPRLPIAITGLNTLVLLASSVTLVTAGRARRRGEPARHVRWLQGTAALGALFLAVQGYEWIRLIGFGLSLRSEEHTSELQSPCNLVCRLLLEKKKKKT